MTEKDLIEIIKKEVEKYLNQHKNESVIDLKDKINFLGDDELLKAELLKKYKICKEAKRIIVSSLNIQELISISTGTYVNEKSEVILKSILNEFKIYLIKDGIEWRNYQNIPEKLYEKYLKAEDDLKSFGIKFVNKIEILETLDEKNMKEYFDEKVLNLRNIKKMIGKEIIISEKTIVTELAQDYIREQNIKVLKRG